jgi:WD40 repeat protein
MKCHSNAYRIISFYLLLQEHTNFVNVVRFSPDGSIFITAGADGKVTNLTGCFETFLNLIL